MYDMLRVEKEFRMILGYLAIGFVVAIISVATLYLYANITSIVVLYFAFAVTGTVIVLVLTALDYVFDLLKSNQPSEDDIRPPT